MSDSTTDPTIDPASGDDHDWDGPSEVPSTPPPRAKIPRQIWLVIAGLGVLILVAGFFAAQGGTPSPEEDGPGEGIIEALVPAEGSEVLQQGRFGIDLVPGWDASLVINNQQVPDDQLTKVDGLDQVFFVPGPGQIFEALPSGQNCVSARFWEIAQGPADAIVRTWCFDVT